MSHGNGGSADLYPTLHGIDGRAQRFQTPILGVGCCSGWCSHNLGVVRVTHALPCPRSPSASPV